MIDGHSIDQRLHQFRLAYLTDAGLPPCWTPFIHLPRRRKANRPSGYPSSLRVSPLPFPTLVRTTGPDRSVNMAHHHHIPRGSLERRVHGLGVDSANRSVSSFASPLGEVDNKSDGSSVTIKASKFEPME